ncbi:DUF6470 family protein [Cohnella sp. REN36]|uniref:DUF6470 family protein n=1 Tax=Cohnella sp. REN36 TaxID=2887347 RepID=UPI001D13D5E3|nr:DUF6470 family protein [Cohnella sp. REN36]MCC3374077.1 DUF6470 family protein [Cohnella sp. REN36]
MEFLRLSIRTTPARIGIESPRGQFDMKSPRGEYEMSSPPADMQIRQPRGELEIDSSASYLAYSMGGVFETSDLLADQAAQRVFDNIGKIAQEGERMKQISNKGNAVAEIASQVFSGKENWKPYGPAGLYNVKIAYTAHPAEIETTPRKPNIEYHVAKPEINYTPGKVKTYLEQMNSIRMWVSSYDLYA